MKRLGFCLVLLVPGLLHAQQALEASAQAREVRERRKRLRSAFIVGFEVLQISRIALQTLQFEGGIAGDFRHQGNRVRARAQPGPAHAGVDIDEKFERLAPRSSGFGQALRDNAIVANTDQFADS